jgi:hypothetical protein
MPGAIIRCNACGLVLWADDDIPVGFWNLCRCPEQLNLFKEGEVRSYCMKCMSPADFIDLRTGECEGCCADAVNAKLVSRQSAAGATKNAAVRQEIISRRSADERARGA